MQHLSDSFSVLDDAKRIADTLIATLTEFEHLQHAKLVHLLSQRELHLHGGRKAAIIAGPKIQGVHRTLFAWMLATLATPHCAGEDPDFVIFYDTAVWDIVSKDRDLGREALVYHELCHLQQASDRYGEPAFEEDDNGVPRPKLKLVPHDIERFDAEIARYGPVFLGLETTTQAIVRGHDAHKKRLAQAT